MPVVKCRRCGAVATAQLRAEEIETSYGASFREKCKELVDPGAADFVSTISACPFMDTALKRVTTRVARQQRGRAGTVATPPPQEPEPDESPPDAPRLEPTALAPA